MPQNPDLLATKTVAGTVCIFDRTKHASNPIDDVVKPQITLRGHSKEGYGLAWNPTDGGKGHILSASEDTTVCHWCDPFFRLKFPVSYRPYRDVNAYSKANSIMEPLAVYKGHTAIVEAGLHLIQTDPIADAKV